MRLRSLTAIAAFSVVTTTASANAQPISVDYNVTGSAGNWLFNFTVTNTGVGAPADLGVYLFGVKVGPTAIAAKPSNWSQFMAIKTTYGSGNTYANVWHANNDFGVGVGNSVSGFSAFNYDQVALTEVKWFAYAISNGQAAAGEWYEGGGNFNGQTYNPGFESTATGTYEAAVNAVLREPDDPPPVVVTPEPSSYVLMASGLLALGYISRRRRQATQQ